VIIGFAELEIIVVEEENDNCQQGAEGIVATRAASKTPTGTVEVKQSHLIA
jgi:hypothetical protein